MTLLACSQMLATTALDVMAALQINAGQGVALAARIINADKVEDWVAYGGPWMVFGLLFLCGLGFPLPEEIPIMAAGYFIGTGRMGWALTCVLAWCGIIAGDCILYWFGRRLRAEHHPHQACRQAFHQGTHSQGRTPLRAAGVSGWSRSAG